MSDETEPTLAVLAPTPPRAGAVSPVVDLDAIAGDLDAAGDLAERSRANNTRAAYAGAWRWFAAYCDAHGSTALPAHPATVAAFLAARAAGTAPRPVAAPGTRRPAPDGPRGLSALAVAASAIRHEHRRRGLASPTDHPQVRAVLDGLARVRGRAAAAPREPVRIEDLIALSERHAGDDSPRWLRDWSILLFGFASALRRSNLAALTFGEVNFDPRGLAIFVRKSKTDQEGTGRWVGVLRRTRLCPARALEAWLAVSPPHTPTSPLWRRITRGGRVSEAAVGEPAIESIVKDRMSELGFEAARYGAHSLRAGFATAAKGRSLREVMDQGGWSDPRTALRYQRRAAIFDDNPSDVLP